jgi:hypothetical protein
VILMMMAMVARSRCRRYDSIHQEIQEIVEDIALFVKRFKKLMKEGHKHKGDKKDKTRTIIKRDATIVTSIDTSLQIVYMRRRMKMKARKRRRVIVKARKSPKRNTLVKLILYNNGI